jgi:hypothetical protein
MDAYLVFSVVGKPHWSVYVCESVLQEKEPHTLIGPSHVDHEHRSWFLRSK